RKHRRRNVVHAGLLALERDVAVLAAVRGRHQHAGRRQHREEDPQEGCAVHRHIALWQAGQLVSSGDATLPWQTPPYSPALSLSMGLAALPFSISKGPGAWQASQASHWVCGLCGKTTLYSGCPFGTNSRSMSVGSSSFASGFRLGFGVMILSAIARAQSTSPALFFSSELYTPRQSVGGGRS